MLAGGLALGLLTSGVAANGVDETALDRRSCTAAGVGLERRASRSSPGTRGFRRHSGGSRKPLRHAAPSARYDTSCTSKAARPMRVMPPFDHSGVFDPGLDPFPAGPSGYHGGRQGQRRSARHQGQDGRQPADPARGQRLLLLAARQPPGDGPRRLLVGGPDARHAASAAGEDSALLARPLRHQRGQGPRLPQDAASRSSCSRQQGLGNFHALLVAVAKDPAMLAFLDAGINVKGSPNENFAREIMELFTMGPGQLHRDGHPRGRARLHRDGTSAARTSRSTPRITTRARSPSWAAWGTSTARRRSRSSWSSRPRRVSWRRSSTAISCATISTRRWPRCWANGCARWISRSHRSSRCCFRAGTSTRPRPSRRASRARWSWWFPPTGSWACRSCRACRTSTPSPAPWGSISCTRRRWPAGRRVVAG